MSCTTNDYSASTGNNILIRTNKYNKSKLYGLFTGNFLVNDNDQSQVSRLDMDNSLLDSTWITVFRVILFFHQTLFICRMQIPIKDIRYNISQTHLLLMCRSSMGSFTLNTFSLHLTCSLITFASKFTFLLNFQLKCWS